jgi:thioredoxin-related protein
LREEQWIVPVWHQMLKSKWCTFADSVKINFFLKMAAKNPVGSKATDLDFVTIQGQKGKLSEIEAEYLLVYFYVPGCAQCAITLEWIQSDSAYQAIHQAGLLQALAFYPEKDITLFQTYRGTIPGTWINARDPDGMNQLEEEQKYQMRGAPTIYLLDKNKNVILKDARLDLLFIEFEKAREKHLKNQELKMQGW